MCVCELCACIRGSITIAKRFFAASTSRGQNILYMMNIFGRADSTCTAYSPISLAFTETARYREQGRNFVCALQMAAATAEIVLRYQIDGRISTGTIRRPIGCCCGPGCDQNRYNWKKARGIHFELLRIFSLPRITKHGGSLSGPASVKG